LRFFTLLSLFFYANLCLALGLGDAELKSNLGERFLAKIDISDVESTLESSCFSATDIGDVPAIKRANVNLKANNGHYQLSITSNDVITEPIVNLRISFHCDTNLNRDYVLLLDPAPLLAIDKSTTQQEQSNSITSSDNAQIQNKKTRQANAKKTPSLHTTDLSEEAPPAQSKAKKSPKKQRTKSIDSVDKKISEAYTGKLSTSDIPPSKSSSETQDYSSAKIFRQSTDKPFLVISSGNAAESNAGKKPGLSLRIATEIDLNRPAEILDPQSATDAMDEITVMTNRLAHLEKQMVSLQTRNTQLISDAKKIKEESERFDWLRFLNIALAILVILAALEWLRRKLSNREASAKATWFNEEKSVDADNQHQSLNTNLANEFDTPARDDLNITHTQSTAHIAKEDYGSIIEDADVFIEHDRPTLAIQLLQNHLIDSPTDSPAVWLKLLNLLSKEGSEAEYDSAVVECNKYFNIQAGKYGSNIVEDNGTIEDYPHIVARLEGVWGSPYAVGFLNDLISNKRSQPREGLNQGAFNDLFFLKTVAKSLEHTNSTVFKASPEPSSSGQLSANLTGLATTNIENANFNDALFTETESLANESANTSNSLSDTKLGTKSNFNTFNDEASYEVNMLPHEEELLELSTFESDSRVGELKFETPAQKENSEDDHLFKADEINFSLPLETVEYANNSKTNALNEEITLDFPVEMVTKQEILKNESKTKNKVKPEAKNQSESNEIEWDLPIIEQDTDK
jgi:hypothetical protein